VAKPHNIELPDGTSIPIVYEDRSVLVLDKPAGWIIAPDDWYNTRRNLTLALRSSLENGDWWAKSRSLRFLRIIHRLDAETSGLLLCAKNPNAVDAYSALFETREVSKVYWAVVDGPLPDREWVRRDSFAPIPHRPGVFRVVAGDFKDAETWFKCLAQEGPLSLIEARPTTGRTHQIRLHLLASGLPVVGDELYGREHPAGLALRAMELGYTDPFMQKRIVVRARPGDFIRRYGIRWTPPRPELPGVKPSAPLAAGHGKVRPPSSRSKSPGSSGGEKGPTSSFPPKGQK
jgi:RluA family pseudouridine synthase